MGSGLITVACDELFFSEYVEGSSNNKALELTNTGSDPEDLSSYRIDLYSNGNLTVQNQVTLSGQLASGKAYVIANSAAAAEIQAVADITSTVTFFNGNDVLLLKKDGVVVDRIGELGNSATFAANVTLVRNANIVSGDPKFDTPFDPSIEWTT